jgi:hypothetical protein
MPSGRWSHRIRRTFARELLYAAVLDNRVRLYRDGAVVDPITLRDGGFYVRPEQAADGRWTCTMASSAPQWAAVVDTEEDDDGRHFVIVERPPEPLWEVERADLEALIARRATERRGKPAPRQWTTHARDELARIQRNRLLDLAKTGAVRDHLKQFLQQKIRYVPRDDRQIDKLIRAFRRGA